MPLTPYATSDQAKTWLGSDTVPAAVDRYLRSATLIVAKACNVDPYTFVPQGDQVQPLQDAVCAQVASWITLGIDPAALGLDSAPVKKSSILSGDVERDTTGQTAALQAAAGQLCPEAYDILLQVGLLWQAVPTVNSDDCLLHYGLSASRPRVSPATANSIDLWSWDA